MEDREGVHGEDVLGGPDAREASADVVGGVVGEEAAEGEAVMDAGVEGTISSELEPVFEIGQPDEDEGEQGLLIPLVIEENVQVIERVLMEEMGLVEEEDGADALFGEILDVGADGEERTAAVEASRGRGRDRAGDRSLGVRGLRSGSR